MTLMLSTTNPSITKPALSVRSLLPRDWHYVVATQTLAAYIGAVIVKEQHEHYVHQNVEWSLAMYDVVTTSGTAAPRSANEIGMEINRRITLAVGDEPITLKVAIEAAHTALIGAFGRRLKVRGWLPGYRTSEGRAFEALELSGDACPNCGINPTGYDVANLTDKAVYCLNSEECGYEAD